MSTSKNKLSDQTLVRCAMIAAVYTVLCLVLQPFSYGAVQVRVAEAFCLLPVFGAEYIVGVTLGCLLANLLGSTMVDVVFGTAATLIACLATYALRNVRWKGLAIPASFPPVIANALIVGAFEITVFFSDSAPTATMAIQYTREGETSLEEKAYELADKILQEDSSNQNTREKLKKAILAGYNLHHEDFDD